MARMVLFYFLFVLNSSNAWAGVENRPITNPSSTDERLMRQATVNIGSVVNGVFVQRCSGVVGGVREVVTAGHCFGAGSDLQAAFEQGRLVVQVFDPKISPQLRNIQVTGVNSKFDSFNDLARLKLGFDIPIQQSLPRTQSCDQGSSVYSAGFGIDDQNKTSNVVRISEYRFVGSHGEWGFYESEKGKACFGDSGGPIFCKSKGRLAIAGINSGIESNLSIANGSYDKNQFCKLQQKLTTHSVNSDVLELWRHADKELPPAAPVKREGLGRR